MDFSGINAEIESNLFEPFYQLPGVVQDASGLAGSSLSGFADYAGTQLGLMSDNTQIALQQMNGNWSRFTTGVEQTWGDTTDYFGGSLSDQLGKGIYSAETDLDQFMGGIKNTTFNSMRDINNMMYKFDDNSLLTGFAGAGSRPFTKADAYPLQAAA